MYGSFDYRQAFTVYPACLIQYRNGYLTAQSCLNISMVFMEGLSAETTATHKYCKSPVETSTVFTSPIIQFSVPVSVAMFVISVFQ